MGIMNRKFAANAVALAIAGTGIGVSTEMLPTAISSAGGHAFADAHRAAVDALKNEEITLQGIDLSAPIGPTPLGVDLANARMQLIVQECSKSERANALTQPVNRPACAETQLSEAGIRSEALKAVRDRLEPAISAASAKETAYNAGVVGAQFLLASLSIFVGLGARRYIGNGGGGTTGNRRGRKTGKEVQLDLGL